LFCFFLLRFGLVGSVRLKELTHEWSVRSLSYETLIAKYIGDRGEFASSEDILNRPKKQVVPKVTKVLPVAQLKQKTKK